MALPDWQLNENNLITSARIINRGDFFIVDGT